MFDQKSRIVQAEVKKDELREVTTSLSTVKLGISNTGTLTSDIKNRPTIQKHRYYGGKFLTSFRGQKMDNSYAMSYIQKIDIGTRYSIFRCNIINDTLVCRGEIVSFSSNKYDIRIEFRAGESPRVYILNPEIIKTSKVHVYREGNLCLFYSPDLKWKDKTSIAEFTIPWTIEWIHLYELWLITGKWEAPEKKHARLYQ